MTRYTALLSASTLAILASCGGGSGSDDSGGLNLPIATLELGAGDASAPADTVDASVLQQKAAENAGRAIGVNITGARAVTADTNMLVSAATLTDGMLNDDNGFNVDELIPMDSVDAIDGNSDRLLLATLGLDGSGRAIVERTGNRITIDPDDEAVCAGEIYLGDDDLQQCLELVRDLTVELDAVTEESGQISYLFQNDPLLSIIYGPNDASYELDLGTYFRVESAAAAFLNETTEIASMSGKVRFVMNIDNANSGSESGRVTLAVPESVVINANDGSRFSLAAANILTMSSDVAAGTASIELGMAALEILASGNDGAGDSSLSMSGLGGIFNFDERSDGLSVRNLSFGRAPIRLNVEGSEVEISLSPFGFDVSSDGELTMAQALGMAFSMVTNDPDAGQISLSARLEAPAGTRIGDGETEADIVKSGGPLSLNYSATAAGQSASGLVTLAPGSCQNSAENDPNNPIGRLISCQ